MSALFLIGRIYLQGARHHLIPFNWKNYLPLITLLIIGVFILVMEFLGFRKVFGFMYTIQDLPLFFVQALLERLIGLIFLISYSMIFMSSMINGLSSFYVSTSLPFLHTLPIQRWKILLVRFCENWMISCYLVAGFLAGFLASHAYSFHLNWRNYALAAILLVLFTISPVALGTAMVTLLIRFFPVKRIHQVVTFMGGIFLG